MYSGVSAGGPAVPSSQFSDDRQLLLRVALANLAQRTHFPIVFGGFAEKDHVIVSQLVGNRQHTLRGLAVRSGWGLGGRVLQEGRPRLTSNYQASRVITHDYDAPVLAEGINTLLAIPVMVGPSVRAVLYGGLRTSLSIGDVSIEPATKVAQELATALSSSAEATPGTVDLEDYPLQGDQAGSARLEELRRLFADVRGITTRLTDPDLRAQLEAIECRITSIASGASAPRPTTPGGSNLLTAREIDVLSLVALGCTNATVGRTLGVTEATVKSYMNAAMRKLGAETRYEAVTLARRLRLLP